MWVKYGNMAKWKLDSTMCMANIMILDIRSANKHDC